MMEPSPEISPDVDAIASRMKEVMSEGTKKRKTEKSDIPEGEWKQEHLHKFVAKRLKLREEDVRRVIKSVLIIAHCHLRERGEFQLGDAPLNIKFKGGFTNDAGCFKCGSTRGDSEDEAMEYVDEAWEGELDHEFVCECGYDPCECGAGP